MSAFVSRANILSASDSKCLSTVKSNVMVLPANLWLKSIRTLPDPMERTTPFSLPTVTSSPTAGVSSPSFLMGSIFTLSRLLSPYASAGCTVTVWGTFTSALASA